MNGAGKTTVFKILTGEIAPSIGDAYVQGFSIRKDMAKVTPFKKLSFRIRWIDFLLFTEDPIYTPCVCYLSLE